jgi:hypothetical protein
MGDILNLFYKKNTYLLSLFSVVNYVVEYIWFYWKTSKTYLLWKTLLFILEEKMGVNTIFDNSV